VVRPNGQPAILKLFHASKSATARAAREHGALSACRHRSIPEVLEFESIDGETALLLSRLPGLPLSRWTGPGRGRSLESVLDLAIQWCDILANVHHARFVHRDFHPQNLLIDSASGEVSLIDFGLARPLGAVEHVASDLTSIEGTLQYIAPEQTGRMNRGCDSRSDLYALGATLYFAWTGHPPFDTTDPLELIHAHMARTPPALEELRAETPPAFAKLVAKLLEKQPDARYRSARMLQADLTSLRRQLDLGPIPHDFELCAENALERPVFPQELYGREAESRCLADAHARARKGGSSVVWVSGQAGTGKSALVDTLRPAVAESSGYLAMGKFDLYSERPYAGWTAALGSLIEQMLVESDVHLAQWRKRISAAVGPIAAALFELAPDLAYLIEDAPPIPSLDPRPTRERLALALERLLGAVVAPEHPLVLFLDDVQWIDSGSQFLLEHVLSNALTPGIVLIAAYRSETLDSAEGEILRARLERLHARTASAAELELGPLSREATCMLLAKSLACAPEELAGLVELVERKTSNVPLLVRQFIDHLSDRDLLTHEIGSGWHWDLDRISQAAIPDGAVALMTAKIDRLPRETREVLALASCVSDQFALELLAEVSETKPDAIQNALFELADVGLITPCPGGFRFAHDRIREAAQSGISSQARARLHADTGRLLLERTPAQDRDLRAFEIADHLNRGHAFLDESLRAELVDLNFRAGRLALRRGAVAEAHGYLSRSCDHTEPADWQTDRERSFERFLTCAESAFLSSAFEAALARLDQLDAQKPSRNQLVQIAALRIRIWTLLKPPVECLEYMLAVLRELGIRWPLHPSRGRAKRALWWMRLRLRLSNPRSMRRAPSRGDDIWAARIQLIDAAGAVTARVDGYLLALISSLILRLNLRFGYSSPPAYNLAVFAMYAHSVLFDGKLIARILAHAEEWLQREPDPVFGPRTEFTLGIAKCWVAARRSCIRPLPRLGEVLREIGDPEFAYYADFQHAIHSALAGVPVSETLTLFDRIIERVRRSGHHYPNPEGSRRAYHLLDIEDASKLDLDAETEGARAWFEAHPGSAQTPIRTLWLLVLVVYRREDLAFAQSEALGRDGFRVLPFVHLADHTLYRGLAAGRLARSSDDRKRRRGYLTELERAHKRLRHFASYGPDMIHMALLLEAERTAVTGAVERAVQQYEAAARAALQHEFPHNAALAYERRARLLASRNRSTDAERALNEAAALYASWGARAKARLVRREQQEVIET